MCAPFNLKLVTAEAPSKDTTTTNLLGDVKNLFMEDVAVMGTDLVTSVTVNKLVFHQVSM